jgi:hypothetical protein
LPFFGKQFAFLKTGLQKRCFWSWPLIVPSFLTQVQDPVFRKKIVDELGFDVFATVPIHGCEPDPNRAAELTPPGILF